MQTTAIKRKNIDLPIETLQKLSLVAVASGKSLKAYIESILIAKASSISVSISSNPSPSNDEWFDNADNLSSVDRGVAQAKAGKSKAYSMEEIKEILGV